MDLDRLQSPHVVGYTRVSSGEQKKGWSMGSQREAIEVFCQNHALTLHQIFEDPGRSGHSTRSRHGLLDLIRCIQKGRFGAVITWREDRLGRRLTDNQDISVAISSTGAALINLEPLQVDFGPTDGASGLNLRQLHQILAEHEWSQIRSRILPNLTAACAAGVRGGHTPFGYLRIDRQTFVIDDRSAALVLEIFQRIDQGSSIRSIAGYLAERGVVDARGKALSIDRLRHLLRNRFYLGEHVWQVPSGMRPTHGERVQIPDHHPALVDPSLFDRVQQQLDRRAPQTRRSHEIAVKQRVRLGEALEGRTRRRSCHGVLPPGHVHCGMCGCKVYARLQTRGSRTQRYQAAIYECERHKTQGAVACPQPPVLVAEIDPRVNAAVMAHLAASPAQPMVPPPPASWVMDRDIAAVNEEIARLRSAQDVATGSVGDALAARVDAAQESLEILKRRQKASSVATPEQVGPLAAVRSDAGVWNDLDNGDRRQVLIGLEVSAIIHEQALQSLAFGVSGPDDSQ